MVDLLPIFKKYLSTENSIYTPALDKVVESNKTYLSQIIKEILMNDFITFEVDILRCTARDLFKELNKNFKTKKGRCFEFKKMIL